MREPCLAKPCGLYYVNNLNKELNMVKYGLVFSETITRKHYSLSI